MTQAWHYVIHSLGAILLFLAYNRGRIHSVLDNLTGYINFAIEIRKTTQKKHIMKYLTTFITPLIKAFFDIFGKDIKISAPVAQFLKDVQATATNLDAIAAGTYEFVSTGNETLDSYEKTIFAFIKSYYPTNKTMVEQEIATLVEEITPIINEFVTAATSTPPAAATASKPTFFQEVIMSLKAILDIFNKSGSHQLVEAQTQAAAAINNIGTHIVEEATTGITPDKSVQLQQAVNAINAIKALPNPENHEDVNLAIGHATTAATNLAKHINSVTDTPAQAPTPAPKETVLQKVENTVEKVAEVAAPVVESVIPGSSPFLEAALAALKNIETSPNKNGDIEMRDAQTLADIAKQNIIKHLTANQSVTGPL